jgi:SM-20-related protein
MDELDEASQIAAAVEELGLTGFAVCPGLLPPELAARLAAEQRRREDGGGLVAAKVARGGATTEGAELRRARSRWFDGGSEAERDFLAFAERLRLAVNRRLMLGLFEFEAQFLHYPPGGFYVRHIDALAGERGRVVSLVAYLNEDWAASDGGALAIWTAEGTGAPVVEVQPLAGTVVLMLSEEIPHEARPALRDRRAIAGWFRVNG